MVRVYRQRDRLRLRAPLPQIDHNPKEERPTNRIWWIVWPIVVLGWIWYLYFFEFTWVPIALGFLTGGILASWAIEVTGNRVPESWRR